MFTVYREEKLIHENEYIRFILYLMILKWTFRCFCFCSPVQVGFTGGNPIDLVKKWKLQMLSPVDILVNYVYSYVKGKCSQHNKTMKKSKHMSSTHDMLGRLFHRIKVCMMACRYVYLIECSRNRVWLLCKQSTRPLSQVVNKVKMKPCWTLRWFVTQWFLMTVRSSTATKKIYILPVQTDD